MYAQGMTRRAFVTLGATTLAMGLFGCGGKTEPEADGGADATAKDSEATSVTGGWETNPDVPTSALSDEEQAVFDHAIEGYDGMELQPVCVLATQVVAGVNYAFLCQGSPTTANPEPGWYVVVVYENLEGACEVSSAKQIDVSEPAVVADDDLSDEAGAIVGGWTVAPQITDDTITIPDKAAAAFALAGEEYVGMDLSPLALLATQVVAGTNYRVLCVGAPVVPNAETRLFVVNVYEDLEGKAEYSNVSTFDLLAYV